MHSVPCESHLSSDEEHLARRQPFIVCHRYHLGNDLFRPVAMATVICMEMMLVLPENGEASDVGGIKRRGYGGDVTTVGKEMRVVARRGVVCHRARLHV